MDRIKLYHREKKLLLEEAIEKAIEDKSKRIFKEIFRKKVHCYDYKGVNH